MGGRDAAVLPLGVLLPMVFPIFGAAERDAALRSARFGSFRSLAALVRVLTITLLLPPS
ncbi:MAG: hypothetical protein JNG88_14775 [Phycisphaerales bacterium]|nr:hypothetical protein [Phycisphaerales bacterium]